MLTCSKNNTPMDSTTIEEPPDLSNFLSIYISEESNHSEEDEKGDACEVDESKDDDACEVDESKDNNVCVQDFLSGLTETTITPIQVTAVSGVRREVHSHTKGKKFSAHFERFGPSNGIYCDICDTWISKQRIIVHERTHTGERPHVCEVCHQTFSRTDKLSQHCRRMHSEKSELKKYKCICGKTFEILGELQLHLACHPTLSAICKERIMELAQEEMQTKPPEIKSTLPCSFCDLRFPGRYKLLRHIRTHTGVKPYKCECGVKFTRNEHLKKHRLCKSCPFSLAVTGHSPSKDAKLVTATTDPSMAVIKSEVSEFSEDTKPDIDLDEHVISTEVDTGEEMVVKRETMSDSEPTMDSDQSQKAMLNETWKKFAKNIRLHICEYCNKIFTKNHKLNIHRRIHTGEKPYSCETCGKGFSRKDHLLKHQSVHLKYRNATRSYMLTKLMAKQQGRADPSDFNDENDDVNDYIRDAIQPLPDPSIHDSPPNEPHSPLIADTKSYMLTKLMAKQQGRPDPSDFDDVNDDSRDAIQPLPDPSIHDSPPNEPQSPLIADTPHPENEKIFYCPICSHGFKKLYNFQSHLETHGERETFKCPICCREFKVKKNFEAHLLNHETTLLDESSSTEVTIANSYLELAKTKRAQCPICKKWLVSQSSLIMHMRSHTGEKPHQCETCDRFFVRKADMMRHRRRHTGENLFPCPSCDVSYTRRDKLAAHIRKNHPLLTTPV